MALITDLPLELLTMIVLFYRNSSTSIPHKGLRDLSLVNKAFNESCAPFLFRRHTISIRSWKTQRYSPSYARMRIAVMARRGRHIRELEIRDFRTIGIEPFPDAVIPDLLEGLKAVNGLNSLILTNSTPMGEGKYRRVPDLLWTWMKERGTRLRYLSIGGRLLPPVHAGTIDGIHELELRINPMNKRSSEFYKVIKSAKR